MSLRAIVTTIATAAIVVLVAFGALYVTFTKSAPPPVRESPISNRPGVEPTPVNYPAPPPEKLANGIKLPDLSDIGAAIGITAPDEVEQGLGGFADPGPMVAGGWYPLEFAVGPNETAIRLATDSNVPEPQAIPTSRVMRVTLVPDPNFEARPQDESAVKNTGRDKTETWNWSVKPLHDGRYKLIARVQVGKLLDDGSFYAWDTYTRHVSIRVKIGTWEGFVRALRRASSAGDLFATLFASWEKTLTALAGLLTASGSVWLAIKVWGKRKGKATAEKAKPKPKKSKAKRE